MRVKVARSSHLHEADLAPDINTEFLSTSYASHRSHLPHNQQFAPRGRKGENYAGGDGLFYIQQDGGRNYIYDSQRSRYVARALKPDVFNI